MVERIDTTPDVIMLRVLDRLRAQVPACTQHNSFLSTEDAETPPNPDELMFEVWFGHNFTFDQSALEGGGVHVLTTVGHVMVTIHLTFQADEVGRAHHYLTNATRGAWQAMTAVLRALCDHELTNIDGTIGSVVGGTTVKYITHHGLKPDQGAVPPRSERKRGMVTFAFEVVFDWNTADVNGLTIPDAG